MKEENFEQTLKEDLDHVWNLALRILGLFEETIILSCPSSFNFLSKIDLVFVILSFLK